jgi:hypothetical protein
VGAGASVALLPPHACKASIKTINSAIARNSFLFCMIFFFSKAENERMGMEKWNSAIDHISS